MELRLSHGSVSTSCSVIVQAIGSELAIAMGNVTAFQYQKVTEWNFTKEEGIAFKINHKKMVFNAVYKSIEFNKKERAEMVTGQSRYFSLVAPSGVDRRAYTARWELRKNGEIRSLVLL